MAHVTPTHSHVGGGNHGTSETSFWTSGILSFSVWLVLSPSLLFPTLTHFCNYFLPALSSTLFSLFSRATHCFAFLQSTKCISFFVVSWLFQHPFSRSQKFLMQPLCAPLLWRLSSFYDIAIGAETLLRCSETKKVNSSSHSPLSQTPTQSGKWSVSCAPWEP